MPGKASSPSRVELQFEALLRLFGRTEGRNLFLGAFHRALQGNSAAAWPLRAHVDTLKSLK